MFILRRTDNGIEATNDCEETFESLTDAGRALHVARRTSRDAHLSDHWVVILLSEDGAEADVSSKSYWSVPFRQGQGVPGGEQIEGIDY